MKALSIGLFFGGKEIIPIRPGEDIARVGENVAFSATYCPANSDVSQKNELGQTCAECIEQNPDRGQICDAICNDKQIHTLPDLSVIAHVSPGWKERVLRRAGEDL